MSNDSRCDDTSIFPLSVQKKVIPRSFMEGLLEGLIRASSIHCISRRSISELKRPREALLGVGLHLINELSNQPGLLTLWRSEGFENLFLEIPYKVPPSYPISNRDLGALGRAFLRDMYLNKYVGHSNFRFRYKKVWIFADINDVRMFGMLSISNSLVPLLYNNKFDKRVKDQIRAAKDQVINLRDPDYTRTTFVMRTGNMLRTNEEIRHACKAIIRQPEANKRGGLVWGKELSVPLLEIEVPYVSQSQQQETDSTLIEIPRIQNPLISGMRLFQFATGSHYKIQSIVQNMEIKFQDALSGGDGSGGIGSYLLRSNPHSRVIFNSLLDLSEVDLRGTAPSPPSAIAALGSNSARCINLRKVWENPSDLSDGLTWEYFIKLKRSFHLNLDLIVLDMECGSDEVSDNIEANLSEYVFKLLEDHGTLIYKTFLHRIVNRPSILMTQVGPQFRKVTCTVSDIASSQTSEVYMVMSGRENRQIPGRPDLRQVLGNLRTFPALRNEEDEFKRALGLKSYNYYKGVPRELINDPIDEMCVALETFGVEAGVTAILGETIKRDRGQNHNEMPYLTVFVALNSILNLTAIRKSQPIPISDGKVYHVGVLMVGFLNWVSLCTGDYTPHHNAQTMIRDHFTLSWADKKIQMKKTGEQGYIRLFSLSHKYPKMKNFHLDALMSQIGQFQRVLIRIFGYTSGNPDTKLMNQLLKIFSDGLSVHTFSSHIDLFQNLTSRTKPFRELPQPSWSRVEQDDGGWTSQR